MTDLLFDTCAIIWTAHDQPLSSGAEDAINRCHQSAERVYISPFSAWELGLLVSKRRLRLPLPLTDWFDQYRINGQCHLADLSPQILADSSFLPGQPPADPADRIFIATARTMDLTLITADKAVLDYADEGHVRALAC